MIMRAAFFSLLVVAVTGAGWAQTNIPYADPSSRESRRESRRTGSNSGTGVTLQPYNPYGGLNAGRGSSATGTPKPGASPTPKADARAKTMTSSKSTATTGTVAKKPGAKPGGANSGSFGQAGQVKEITKEMVASGRTRKVKFNAATAADDPGIILLNPRKLDTLD